MRIYEWDVRHIWNQNGFAFFNFFLVDEIDSRFNDSEAKIQFLSVMNTQLTDETQSIEPETWKATNPFLDLIGNLSSLFFIFPNEFRPVRMINESSSFK